ncbi:hypothetical protein MRX96_034572 [Rhipicephalus microplus]
MQQCTRRHNLEAAGLPARLQRRTYMTEAPCREWESTRPLVDVRKTTNWRARSPLRDGAARSIIVFPLPKNVNPEEDWERRKVRAAALAKQYKSDENAVFVDVTKHSLRRCVYALAVIRESTGELINAGTIKAKTP